MRAEKAAAHPIVVAKWRNMQAVIESLNANGPNAKRLGTKHITGIPQ
jgi:hypothetical protein